MASKSSLIALLCSYCPQKQLSTKQQVLRSARLDSGGHSFKQRDGPQSCIHWEWKNNTSSSYGTHTFTNIVPDAVHPTDNAISTFHHFRAHLLHPELHVNEDKSSCSREDYQNLMALVLFPKEGTVRRSSICSSRVPLWSASLGAEVRLQFLPTLCTMSVLGTANLANSSIN